MASTETIDHTTLERLVEAGAVRGADIVGQPGGWGVVIKYGMTERALAVRRGSVRIFRKFESLVDYLKKLGLAKYSVDASNYDPAALTSRPARPDAAERLRAAHEAAEYNEWLKAKVGASLESMRDGSNPVIDDEEWARERAQWEHEARTA